MDGELLGQRLKTVRELFKLSQKEIAEKIGVKQTHISRLESGRATSDLLIKTLEFYRQYISLDRLLNEKLSILECYQEGLTTVPKELMTRRASLVRGIVNELFVEYQKEQDMRIEEIKRKFNVKMDALEDDR